MTVPMSVQKNIRRLDSQGVPGREIARRLGVSRDSVAKYAEQQDFSPAAPASSARPGGSVLTGFEHIIEGWLAEDQRVRRSRCKVSIHQILMLPSVASDQADAGFGMRGKDSLTLAHALAESPADGSWMFRRHFTIPSKSLCTSSHVAGLPGGTWSRKASPLTDPSTPATTSEIRPVLSAQRERC